MGKKGVSQISGSVKPVVGEKYTYHITGWYPDTEAEKRNPKLVTWELFKQRKNGNFTSTNIRKKGISEFTFGEKAIGSVYKLEAYLYASEGGGLIIHPQPSKIPVIDKVELFYVDDTKGTTFSFMEKLRAKAYCTNMLMKELTFTLWEDDAQGKGHHPNNKLILTKKAKVDKNGVAVAEFMLTRALMYKAMQGEADPKQLEFYVTVEYYKNKKHATENIHVNNTLPPINGEIRDSPAETITKAKDSPAEQKPPSMKEEKGIRDIALDKAKELWDWMEAKGTVIKEQLPTVPEPDGKSPAAVKEPKKEENKVKNCECYCSEKEISPEELKEMVVAMRKATFDNAGENFYKWNKDNLFTAGHETFVDKSYSKFAEVLNKTFVDYDITSCIRKIHFLAQCYHETGGFMRSVEGNLKDEFWYDPYRGRGFIHLTLSGNYSKFKNYSGYDVITNPKIVSTDIEAAAKSSGWYWKYNDIGNINPFADKDSIFDTSRLVNKPNATKPTSINGYSQRVNAVNALKTVFKYPQSCCSLGKKEETKKEILCPSSLKECICLDTFAIEDGFIKSFRVTKNRVDVIEQANFRDPQTSIQKIILHRTAGGTTEACINAFKSGRRNKRGGIDHYGTHFIVGKDGTITQTAHLSKVTWHCAGWNSKSVGIEVVGFAIDRNGKPTLGLRGQNPVSGWEELTESQAKSVACLVKALLKYYNLDNSKIDCHEHLAPKQSGEGQVVFNAIKDYL